MRALIIPLMVFLTLPVYASVNYNSDNDATPSDYQNRIQQEQQQDLSRQRQDEANDSAARYYNSHPGNTSSYGNNQNTR